MKILSNIASDKLIVKESSSDLSNYTAVCAESYLVENATAKRQREFNSSRNLARAALSEMGVENYKITKGEKGEPLWPPSIVGSITHCEGYRAVAVANKFLVRTVGIDAEPHEALDNKILPSVASLQEIEHMNELTNNYPNIFFDKLLFSAKEAVYKAWYPLTKRWLGFHDAALTFEVIKASDSLLEDKVAFGRFRADILINSVTLSGETVPVFSGKWLVNAGLIGTIVEM